MFDWLKSRYTRSLEKQIEDLKIAHAKELEYVKSELAWHKEESERLRRFLHPTLQPIYDQVRANNDPIQESTPPVPDKYAGLTPWQRAVAKDLEEQDAALAKRNNKQAQAPAPNEAKTN